MIIRLFIISGLCKNVKELERLLVCEDRKLYLGLWCNGSTTDFGSVSPSSNLGSPTITGDLRCGNRHLRGVRLVNSSYGNKPKEFESLRLTNY